MTDPDLLKIYKDIFDEDIAHQGPEWQADVLHELRTMAACDTFDAAFAVVRWWSEEWTKSGIANVRRLWKRVRA